MGPFEEEEKGAGIASDVKVEGEDPATPGVLRGNKVRWYASDPFQVHRYVLLGPTLRKPQDRTDSPISV